MLLHLSSVCTGAQQDESRVNGTVGPEDRWQRTKPTREKSQKVTDTLTLHCAVSRQTPIMAICVFLYNHILILCYILLSIYLPDTEP